MSLLDDGPDTVVLYPDKVITDSLGNVDKRVPDRDNPVTLTGQRVQPLASTESVVNGQQISTTYVFRPRDFPAGAFALASWDGREWDVKAEPARRNGSSITRHSTVILSAREAEVVS